MNEAGAKQGKAVVDAVDFGDDVQPVPEVGAVPAAEEFCDQSGRGSQQRDTGQPLLVDDADGEFADGQVGDEGKVFALPFDDVIAIRVGTDTYMGMALACLVAGDRYHHLAADIRPRLGAGQTVICDRYVPSSLVLQRMDGISWDVITGLNSNADRPDLAVILNGDPHVIATRLVARGRRSRFERQPGSSATECRLYHDTAARLADAGWPVCIIDVTTRCAHEAAMMVTDRILTLHADREREQP